MSFKSSSSDSPSSFAVYVFRERNTAQRHKAPKRLSWLRDTVCNDLNSALTRAELMRDEPGVRRVQIFEQVFDRDGNARAGRIIRTLNHSRLKELFAIN